MTFTCPRCGGSFWQEEDFSDVTRIADAMIAEGRNEDALWYAKEEVRRRA